MDIYDCPYSLLLIDIPINGRVFSAHLGGTIDFDLANRFYLQSGPSFFKKGGGNLSGNFNLCYSELPVNARFDFLEVGQKVIFMLGLAFTLTFY